MYTHTHTHTHTHTQRCVYICIYMYIGIVRGLTGVQWADAQLVRYQGCIKINQGRVEEYLLEAGHWLHVMKPDELIAIRAPGLRV